MSRRCRSMRHRRLCRSPSRLRAVVCRTILTALCGAALMGGAVFTSLDGETNFASLPERVEVALRGALGGSGDRLGARKSDRLPTAEERISPAR